MSDPVPLASSTIDAGNLAFDYTFPAHSVTGFRLVNATPFNLIDEQLGLVGLTGGGSFASQLASARASLSNGSVTASCNELDAYVHHVITQSGKQLGKAGIGCMPGRFRSRKPFVRRTTHKIFLVLKSPFHNRPSRISE